jgi:succinate dehydrogenase / fumarate reductase cytochrome b subunit
LNGLKWLAWLVFGSSSIGKKTRMAITGLGLCAFLVVHLSGNLLLYKPDGGEAYNAYATMLHSGEMETLIVVAEIGLLVMFVLHLYLSLKTTWENTQARPVEYAMKQTKQESSMFAAPANSVMMVTGIAILLFTILHLADFRFKVRPPKDGWVATAKAGHHQAITRTDAINLMKDPLTAGVYIVGSLLLGYHLAHGFYSAFHTLGASHPQYSPKLLTVSIVFATIIGLGFASFPIWAQFVNPAREVVPPPGHVNEDVVPK